MVSRTQANKIEYQINAVNGNNRYLLPESHKTHQYKMWAELRYDECKTDGTYVDH
jgi:hypothetical protein